MKNKRLFMMIVITLILANSMYLFSAYDEEDIKKGLPKMLGSCNAGTEFYFTFIPCWETSGTGNDLMIYVTSNVRTKVVVTVQDKGWQEIKYTVPNEITAFKLAPSVGQAYRKTDREIPEQDQVWNDAGIHIVADDPIVCYGMTRYKYTSDGFMVLPVNVLGSDYIVASWADPADDKIQWLSSYTGVVAAYDKTKLEFTMGGTTWSQTASGLNPGQTSVWNMNEGDVFLVGSLGSQAELTGSRIKATKPVAVVSGNFCAYIPTNCGCCDHISSMELPLYSWGNYYHVTPIKGRVKSSMIKIFAKEPNTIIYRDGVVIDTISDAGGIDSVGYITVRADSGTPYPVVISGNKPINITQFNTSQSDDNIPSDPFQSVLNPYETYQKEFTFQTPGIQGGLGFNKNYVNLVFPLSVDNKIPDDLEIGEFKDGLLTWTKIKDHFQSVFFPFAYNIEGKKWGFKNIELPVQGVYKLRSNKPFNAFSYGFSSWDSYGLLPAVSIKENLEDSIPPKVQYTKDKFGDVSGTVDAEFTGMAVSGKADEVQSAIPSHLSIAYMLNANSYNYIFECSDFWPYIEYKANWTLKVIDQSKEAGAVLAFSDRSGNDTIIFIENKPIGLAVQNTNYDWGAQKINEFIYKQIKVTNVSSSENVIVNRFYLKTGNKGFELFADENGTPLKYPLNIPAGNDFTFFVRFGNNINGLYYDSLKADYGEFTKSLASFKGVIGGPIIKVTDIVFPKTCVNCRNFKNINISNRGNAQLIITDFEGPYTKQISSNNDVFKLKSISQSEPLIVQPSKSVDITLYFDPDEERDYLDSIKFISNSIKDQSQNPDSVCLISSYGYVIANNFDWGNKRIITNDIMKSYPAFKDNPVDSGIVFKNFEDRALKLIKVNIPAQATCFYIDTIGLSTITIEPNTSKRIPVFFKPDKPGNFQALLNFTNSFNAFSQCVLKGKGVIPRIDTDSADFGETECFRTDSSKKITVNIKNRDYNKWQFADTLTITGIIESNVLTNINSWDGATPYRYDKSLLNFPLRLLPGDSLSLEVEFLPNQIGYNPGNLRIESDAENQGVIELSGIGKQTVDVNDNNLSHFISIYPKPVKESVNIKFHFKFMDDINIRLSDLSGKSIIEKIFNINENEIISIPLDGIHNGTYFITIDYGYGQYTEKITIMK